MSFLFGSKVFHFFKRFYLFIHEKHTEWEAETQAEGEAGEPDVGIDPKTPGSQPELNADAQPLSHPGAPSKVFQIQVHCIYSYSSFIFFAVAIAIAFFVVLCSII